MNWRRTVYQATTSFAATGRANMEDKRRRWINRKFMERLAYLR